MRREREINRAYDTMNLVERRLALLVLQFRHYFNQHLIAITIANE